jgi:hypothetical protein
MMVKTECNGRKVTGLYIGARNVRRNFPREVAAIEFELGHLRIDCELGPEFWRDQPRICDSRLCEWLQHKLYHETGYMKPLPLALVQSGRNAYKLRPVLLPPVSLIADLKGSVLISHAHAKAAGASHKPHRVPVHYPAAV